MKRRYYFLLLIIFTSVLWTISWSFTRFMHPDKVPGLIAFQFAYFTLLTGTIHLLLRKAAGGRPIQFVNAYMLASTFKLLLTLSVILVISYRRVVEPVPFVIHFSSLYLAYTVFEIYFILRVLRNGRNP